MVEGQQGQSKGVLLSSKSLLEMSKLRTLKPPVQGLGRDGSVVKALAVQAWGWSFDPPSYLPSGCNSSLGRQRQSLQSKLAGKSSYVSEFCV